MDDALSDRQHCAVRRPPPPGRRERGVLLVTLLTAVTMVVEIAAGYATNSMALLADGWHMATHVGALGLASAAYALSRRYAAHRAFVFGTGKIRALAGYTSALLLGIVAAAMAVESVERLLRPHVVDFARSLPVAVVGLVVNLASVLLLHTHSRDGDQLGGRGDGGHDHGGHGHDHGGHDHGGHGHGHGHVDVDGEHDHNHQAAFMHVVADTLTSALAIAALLAGRSFGWTWLDSVTGVVGGVVIVHWGVALSRRAAAELLDVAPPGALEEQVRRALESIDDVRVVDLHVWSLGGGAKSCIVTLVSAEPRPPNSYRARLAGFKLAHLTIEVHHRPAVGGPSV
jgi:cation diffusion facilitator family transporter